MWHVKEEKIYKKYIQLMLLLDKMKQNSFKNKNKAVLTKTRICITRFWTFSENSLLWFCKPYFHNWYQSRSNSFIPAFHSSVISTQCSQTYLYCWGTLFGPLAMIGAKRDAYSIYYAVLLASKTLTTYFETEER